MQSKIDKCINNITRYFNEKRILGIFLLSVLLCFLVLINLALPIFLKSADMQIYNFNQYVLSFVNPYKYITFVQYGFSICIIGFYALGCFFLFKNEKLLSQITLNKNVVPLIAIYAVILLFIKTSNVFSITILFFIFILLLISSITISYDKLKTISFFIVLTAVFVQFFLVFYPFVFEKTKIMNEFFDIPEISLIKTEKGVIEIDNIDFYSKNNIIGFQNKYDIRNPQANNNITSISFKYTQKLDDFLQKQNYDVNIYHLPNKENTNNINYFYYLDGRLHLIGQITKAQEVELTNIASTNEEIQNLKTFNHKEDFDVNRDNPVENFIKSNSHEFHWQILNRYYLHHQNHLYAPINELLLGKDINKIFFQYGKYNALILSKIINTFGGFDFTKYMKITYSFYYIYVALFTILVFKFFKRKDYIISWVLLTVASFNFITDEFLRIAPGINPIRHFFDIFVFMFLYLYFKKRNKALLISSFAVIFLSILNESMTGIFMLLALIAALFVKNFIFDKKNYFEISMLIFSPIFGLAAKKLGESGVDYATGYFLSGLLGFPTPKTSILTCLILITLGYVVLLKDILTKEENKNDCIYFYISAFFYVQALLFYYMWGSDRTHLMVYFPIFSFVFLAYLFDSNLKTKYPKIHSIVISLVLIFSVIFYANSTQDYFASIQKFNNIFKTHKVYEWNMPHTNFISTMNPEYFEDSIRLIKKYSKNNGIYMISKYDSFLPIISSKYSNMPFIEVSNFLTSKKEIELNINTIKIEKPEYIFVDKDIDRDFAQDIVWNEYEFKYIFYESMWRYQRLSLLKDIFNAVRKDYEPVESSYLLTVWRNKK